jgi:hypothetical protein
MRMVMGVVAVGLWSCAPSPALTPRPVAPPTPVVQAPPPPPPPDPRVVAAKAEAAFQALEPAFQAQLAIADPPSETAMLKRALSVKAQGLAKLEREYRAITVLGSVPWAVASYVRLGMAYEDIAQFLRNAKPPEGLLVEQAEAFRKTLDRQSAPVSEKAATAYRRAVAIERAARSNDAGEAGPDAADPADFIAYARERLRVLDPDRPLPE